MDETAGASVKRYKHLYASICDFQNLLSASRKAQCGKRFRAEVARFNMQLERELLTLQRELQTKTYRHGKYNQFPIFEGKRRIISAAPYRDRIVHHALCNIIEPLFDQTFIHDSYACRKGRGTHAAVQRLTQYSRRNRYFLKLDIQKYFSRIHHETLISQISRMIGDIDVIELIQEILNSYQASPFLDKRGNYLLPMNGPVGIPIGNLTSQFFANVYLNSFDHWIKETLRCKAFIRYVDDFVCLHDSKKRLHEYRERIRTYLSDRLSLSVHEKRCQVAPVRCGIDFLGYRTYPTHCRLRDGNGYRFLQRMKELKKQYLTQAVTLPDVRQSVVSWIGHASHADTWGLRTELLNQVVF